MRCNKMFKIGPVAFKIDRGNRKVLLCGDTIDCNFDAVVDIIDNPNALMHRVSNVYKVTISHGDTSEKLIYDKDTNSIVVELYNKVDGYTFIDAEGYYKSMAPYCRCFSYRVISNNKVVLYDYINNYDVILSDEIPIVLIDDQAIINDTKYKLQRNLIESIIPRFGEPWSNEHDVKVRDILCRYLDRGEGDWFADMRDRIKYHDYYIGLLVKDIAISVVTIIDNKMLEISLTNIEVKVIDNSNIINLKTATLLKEDSTVIELTNEEVTINGVKATEQIERGIRLLLK